MSTLNPFYSIGTYTSGPYTVHIGFTSRSAGNLGLHVNAGEPHTATLKTVLMYKVSVVRLLSSTSIKYTVQILYAPIIF